MNTARLSAVVLAVALSACGGGAVSPSSDEASATSGGTSAPAAPAASTAPPVAAEISSEPSAPEGTAADACQLITEDALAVIMDQEVRSAEDLSGGVVRTCRYALAGDGMLTFDVLETGAVAKLDEVRSIFGDLEAATSVGEEAWWGLAGELYARKGDGLVIVQGAVPGDDQETNRSQLLEIAKELLATLP